MNSDLLAIGDSAITAARTLGADEVTVWVSQGTYTDVKQRDGGIEKWQDSCSRSLSTALLVDDRYSVHSTNDLRLESLNDFLSRAVQATRHLEPDPHRRLADESDMGSAEHDSLDLVDTAHTGDIDHREWVDQIQKASTDAVGDGLRSAQGFVWSGGSERIMLTSNGFQGGHASTEFGHGSTLCMEDKGGKLPEAYEYAAARYHSDLPPISAVAERVAVRSRGRLGSGPVNSQKGTMLVENRSVNRILGVLLSPLSGGAIFEGRSCMSEKLGERIGAASFTLVDDPHVVRGMGSRLYDGDARPTTRRTLVDKGVLQTWFLDLYNARRLKRQPTVGSTSNLIVAPGGRTPEAILGDTTWAIHVDGFLGGNSNPATGRFSFGIRGTLWEQGQPVAPVSEMNITGSIFDLLDGFLEAADDPWHTGACRSPSLLFDAVQFSGA